MAEPIYLIKPVRDETLAEARADVLKAAEVAAANAGLACRRAGPNLEVQGKDHQVHAIIRSPAVNPEGLTVYMESASSELGACPAR